MTRQLIQTNHIYLWCETFGKREYTPILLIQGSGAQGILWLSEFCEKLAQNGFYVIRYDHRDTGQSSYVDYNKKPYQLKDLMEDAKGILDKLELEKAHIIGSSMGGYIAQLLSIHYSERVLSLTLMMSSFLSISLEHAFLESNNKLPLPLPTKAFTDSLLKIGPVPQTQEGLISYMLAIWSAYNGEAFSFDHVYWTSLAKQWVTRTKDLSASYNHRLAVNASPLNRESELQAVHISTLIIHGLLDPFFPIEHAHALQNTFSSSTLNIIEKMGHLFHEAFIDEVLDAIICHLKQHDA